jgi:adenylate cyclase
MSTPVGVELAEHQGRVVEMGGDSLLLAFDSAASALRCAMAVQLRLTTQISFDTGTLRLPFRIGLHLGDVIEKDDGSVYGDGVNIAARLQSLAEPGEVMVSQALRDCFRQSGFGVALTTITGRSPTAAPWHIHEGIKRR